MHRKALAPSSFGQLPVPKALHAHNSTLLLAIFVQLIITYIFKYCNIFSYFLFLLEILIKV